MDQREILRSVRKRSHKWPYGLPAHMRIAAGSDAAADIISTVDSLSSSFWAQENPKALL